MAAFPFRFPFGADPEHALLTERLALEPVVRAHALLTFELWSDPGIYRFIPQDAPTSLDALTLRYTALETRGPADGDEGWLQWMVRRVEDDTYVGNVEATLYPRGSAYVAWMFGSAYWGHGYASEATRAMLDWLVTGHGVSRFDTTIDTRNARSLALARRLGFGGERRIEHADHFKGEWSDEIAMHLELA